MLSVDICRADSAPRTKGVDGGCVRMGRCAGLAVVGRQLQWTRLDDPGRTHRAQVEWQCTGAGAGAGAGA